MNNFVSLDERADIAYRYYYLTEEHIFIKKQCVINDIENTDNIKLIPLDTKTPSLVNQIFNTNIKYVKQIGDKYYFVRRADYNMNIILSLYEDNDHLNDENNNHEKILLLLTYFITFKLTKHIIIPLLNVDLKLHFLRPFLRTIFII